MNVEGMVVVLQNHFDPMIDLTDHLILFFDENLFVVQALYVLSLSYHSHCKMFQWNGSVHCFLISWIRDGFDVCFLQVMVVTGCSLFPSSSQGRSYDEVKMNSRCRVLVGVGVLQDFVCELWRANHWACDKVMPSVN